jgi:cell division septation protein DedD
LTSQTPDDGFHEIQLNGKQLVFLFMAATVVSVVIFLCGVLVGRGVRAERAAVDSALIVDAPVADATSTTAGAPPSTTNDPRTALPPRAVNDVLSYPERLAQTQHVAEDLKPVPAQNTASAPVGVVDAPVPSPRPVPVATAAPASAPKPAPAATGTSTTTATAPPPRPAPPAPAAASKAAFVVQLAALNSRGEADAMAKKLTARGYEAYVQAPANGAPSVFRVRVGNYQTRREAESVAARIEKEGQFKPWVAPR